MVRRLYPASQVLIIAVAIGTAVATNRAADWRPWRLLAVLTVLCVVGDGVAFRLRQGDPRISTAFVPLALAMTLLGPAPAVAIGLLCDLTYAHRFCKTVNERLGDTASTSSHLVVGALLARVILGDVHASHPPEEVALTVIVLFVVANALNFFLISMHKHLFCAFTIKDQVRGVFVPLLPAQLAAAALAAVLAGAYLRFGYLVLLGVLLAMLLFRWLLMPLVRSQERRERLRALQLERLDNGLRARDRERERWAHGLREDTVRDLHALRVALTHASAETDATSLRDVVDGVIDRLSIEIDGLRHLITELRPPGLDAYGLAVALDDLAHTVRSRDGVDVGVTVDTALRFPLPALTERAIYRILETILGAIPENDEGTRVEVSLARSGDGLMVSVKDRDGHRATPNPDRPSAELVRVLESADDWVRSIGSEPRFDTDEDAIVSFLVPAERLRDAPGPPANRGSTLLAPGTERRDRVPLLVTLTSLLGIAALYVAAGALTAAVVALVLCPFVVLACVLVASERNADLLARSSQASVAHCIAESERERARWASEIHDQTVQGLGAIRMDLASARDRDDPAALAVTAGHAAARLGDELGSLRALIADLSPPRLAELGLASALERLTDQASTPRLKVRLLLPSSLAALACVPQLETAAYRLAQEALANVVKHANATRAQMTLELGHALHLIVEDDGCGFDVDTPCGGYGLRSMTDRAALAGGRAVIHSRPGVGTTIHVTLPLPADARARRLRLAPRRRLSRSFA